MNPPRVLRSVCRALGWVVGPVPGWYMLLVEPWARRLSGDVVATSVGGAPMRLDLSEFVQRKHYFRAFERRELRFVRAALRHGDTAVDVGANVGVVTVEAARAVGPTGQVIAVEPVPSNVERLTANAGLQTAGNITVLATAVGATSGVLRLGLTAQQRAVGNMGSFSATVDDDADAVEVPIRPLDELIGEQLGDGARVRLLKIDVEGMEPDVVRGAARSLSSGLIDYVLFERNPTLDDDRTASLLEQHGFVIHRLAVGGRLRPASAAPTAREHRDVAGGGPLGTVVSWLRGDARLETLVATWSAAKMPR